MIGNLHVISLAEEEHELVEEAKRYFLSGVTKYFETKSYSLGTGARGRATLFAS